MESVTAFVLNAMGLAVVALLSALGVWLGQRNAAAAARLGAYHLAARRSARA